MNYRLRDGSYVVDPRLDRLVEFDDRSRNYCLTSTIPTEQQTPRSFSWDCPLHLDQGTEGACAGFGSSHLMAAEPLPMTGLGYGYARQLYFEGQKIDNWPGGSYPGAEPRYEGTSLLAVLKVLKSMNLISEYRWTFSLQEMIMGVGYFGPALLGVPWFQGMQPDRYGFIKVRGRQTGGHCLLCKGVNIDKEYFILHNSWGKDWGRGGDCYITWADMDKLISIDGEVVFVEKNKV